MVRIYNGILAIKRNEFESVKLRWMNLESVIQSEETQKEKSRYCISCICMASKKIGQINLFVGKEWRCRCKNRLVDTVEGGEGRTN